MNVLRLLTAFYIFVFGCMPYGFTIPETNILLRREGYFENDGYKITQNVIEEYKGFIQSQTDALNYLIYDVDKDGFPELFFEIEHKGDEYVTGREYSHKIYTYEDGEFRFLDTWKGSGYNGEYLDVYASYPNNNGVLTHTTILGHESLVLHTLEEGKFKNEVKYEVDDQTPIRYYFDEDDQEYKDSRFHKTYINHQFYKGERKAPYCEGSYLLAQSDMDDYTALYEAFKEIENNSHLKSDDSVLSTQRKLISETVFISNEEEWLSFSEEVSQGKRFSNHTIILTSDLDFEGYEVKPVGSDNNPFCGKLNGEGHTISNYRLSSNEEYVGLFAVAKDATIQGLSLDNCEIISKEALGTGGFVGFADNCIIKECVFRGYIYGQYGSVGGIVGNNWSEVIGCDGYGTIIGSTQEGMYSLGGTPSQWHSYGTGGIVGDNEQLISLCINYADIYDDTVEHESNTSRSGGVAGYNEGTIDSCTNYGNVTGGGIARYNKRYSRIRYCFNMGDVYSGIVIGSDQDCVIEYCVNLGNLSGRYSADIVSFWGAYGYGASTIGTISNCLYINSSKAGVVKSNCFDKSSLVENKKIGSINENDSEYLNHLICEDNYSEAYDFLLTNYVKNNNLVILIALIVALFVVIFGIHFLYHSVEKKKAIYKKGKNYYKNKQYWESFRLLSTIKKYKDSEQITKDAISKIFLDIVENDIIEMGEYLGENLFWIKKRGRDGNDLFLSTRALFASRIDNNKYELRWEDSYLYHELNNIYKYKWFGSAVDRYIQIEVSIPKVDDITEMLPTDEQRKCKGLKELNEALISGGNVYWWLIDNKESSCMPFVTAEGVISKKGKTVTAEYIAVRPIFILKGVI